MRNSTHSLILAALFAGLTALGAFLRIPFFPVPFTLQVLLVLLSGLLLGSRTGMVSQGVYILLGLAGLPIFAGGGGVTYALSPTFGYILSYPFAAWMAGRLSRGVNLSLKNLITAALAGLLVIYSFGVSGLYINLNYLAEKKVTSIQVLRIGIIPFLIPDLLKAWGAAFFAFKIGIFRRNDHEQ
ncbi:MAG: biotin transporter BioY [Synergistaceae bacterium]|nr:biotin transporter BioY [Synergistaceae bacterium]